MPSGNKITTNFSNILFKQIKDTSVAKSQQTIIADKVEFMILGNSAMSKRCSDKNRKPFELVTVGYPSNFLDCIHTNCFN